jgi:NRPS condensation-like uncharacterized protein
MAPTTSAVPNKESGNDDDIMKTSWRMPRSFMKKIKQYALDQDITVTDVMIQALEEFFSNSRSSRARK